jgi:hypothetical protein
VLQILVTRVIASCFYVVFDRRSRCHEVQSFKDLESADLDDYFNAIRIVRVAGEKPALYALHDYSAYIGCISCLCKVSVEVDQKSMTPRFTDLAAVQIGNGPDFVALRVAVSCGAASSFAYSDRQPVVAKFEHECPEAVSDSGTG